MNAYPSPPLVFVCGGVLRLLRQLTTRWVSAAALVQAYLFASGKKGEGGTILR